MGGGFQAEEAEGERRARRWVRLEQRSSGRVELQQ